LRVRRGGKGIGILLAIAILVVYYLISLLGEAFSRARTTPVVVGAWAATVLMVVLSFVFLFLRQGPSISLRFTRKAKADQARKVTRKWATRTKDVGRFGFPSLLDVDVLRSLGSSFFLTFLA